MPPSRLPQDTAREVQNDAPNEATAQMLALVGRRIRDLRKARGLTLSQLAETCAMSSSMLSMVERGLAAPSIASLMVLAEALGKTAADLIAAPSRASDLVVRGTDVRPSEISAKGVRRVMKEDRANGLTITLNEYAPEPPGKDEPDEGPRIGDGQQYGLLLEGGLVIEVEGEAFRLAAGDLISFPSRKPHRMWNEGVNVARSVWIDLNRK